MIRLGLIRPVRSGLAGQFQVRLYPLALLLTISGCAGPMGAIRSDPPPPPPVTLFDGSYRNTIRVLSSFGAAQATAWCESPGQPVITVAHGQFTYVVTHPNIPGNLALTYPAMFAQDGSFSGQIVAGTIFGRVQGNHIEGRIDGSACLYAFTGNRL